MKHNSSAMAGVSFFCCLFASCGGDDTSETRSQIATESDADATTAVSTTAGAETDVTSAPSSTTTTASSTTTGAGTSGSSGGSSTTESSTGAETGTTTGGPLSLGPYPDLSLGPYPSLLTLATDSMLSNAEALDTSTSYGHSAAQGYVLQAIGELLWAARDHDLETREALITAAIEEIAELEASADRVVGGGPAFGLDEAWDAFGDGSTNPAYTAYTWQSGMVALGVAKIARALDYAGDPRAGSVQVFGEALVGRWDEHYSLAPGGGGYWWYSTTTADALAVHNTSSLVAMASQVLSESGGGPALATRPAESAALLLARLSGSPASGYSWNYVDDGYPVAQRRPEDVSHALVTLQMMRHARERDWWTDAQMEGVANTLLRQMWSDHPARLHGRVDGSSGGESEWAWSRAAAIGYAAHGDAPGGDPAVFDYGRSLLFSSYLSRYEIGFEGSTVDSARTLALSLLLARRPASFEEGSAWEMVAGTAGDDAVPAAPGGVRFYTVDWAAPADLARGLLLPARTSTAAGPNILVDLEVAAEPVVVSVTYSSAQSGSLGQWDGTQYVVLATLPATVDENGMERWMRTSVVLNPAPFDYQGSVPGTNVLLQLDTPAVAVHRIEATPLVRP